MRDERGFSMVELMIALLVSVVILGSAVTVMSGAQSTYAHQSDDATVEQEARFAMDFIRRTVEEAGGNPYDAVTTDCPSAGTVFKGIWMDPDGDGEDDDIRIEADAGIPDGLILGSTGACTQPDEDVTIALDPAATSLVPGPIMRLDRSADAALVAWTDSVFTGLKFEYLDASMAATTVWWQVRVVRVTITGMSRTARPGQEKGQTFTMTSDIRLKSR